MKAVDQILAVVFAVACIAIGVVVVTAIAWLLGPCMDMTI